MAPRSNPKSNPKSNAVARKQLQRQILPLDKDLDVMSLYVDLEGAELEEDKYVVGGSRSAKELHNASIRQKKSTGLSIHPEQITSRTTLRIESGERVSFGTYFNGASSKTFDSR
jgi:galactofuranosylgalactofuranosylrhamnosyl-N-acetylglucosaminyl-diphospho-decaprenol beta-1,5/1,6-galactofuranosyltransferase